MKDKNHLLEIHSTGRYIVRDYLSTLTVFDVTKVNLEELRSERRQESLTRNPHFGSARISSLYDKERSDSQFAFVRSPPGK